MDNVNANNGNANIKGGLVLTSLCDLLSMPVVPQEWVWQDRLAAGALGLIVSKPKVGKSTLARNLALAVSRGQSFLGGAVKPGKVLYMVLEERAQDVTADFRTMGATNDDNIAIAEAGEMKQVVATLKEIQPVLLVIDPLIRLVSIKDENSYSEMYRALGPLVDVARQTGTHILSVHHSSKSEKSNAIDTPIGSTAISGAMSTVFYMRREGNSRSIQSVQRIGEDLPETILNFDKSSKTLALGATRAVIAVQSIEEKILLVLQEESMTELEITDAVGGNTKNQRNALRNLTRAGKLIRLGSGTKGKPYRYELSS